MTQPRVSPSGKRKTGVFAVGYTLLRVTRYTTPRGAQQHTCLPTAAAVYLEGGGGGGASGGANAPAGNSSVGAPASSGAAFEDLVVLDHGLVLHFTVGPGGVGITGSAGTNGSATTVQYGSLQWSAGGGFGSIEGGSVSPFTPLFLGCVDGGVATSNSPSALLVKGGPGCFAVRDISSSGVAGNGGASVKAPGGTGASTGRSGPTSANGQAGQLGSAGGGAINCNDSPAIGNAGGNGGSGYLFVWELALTSPEAA